MTSSILWIIAVIVFLLYEIMTLGLTSIWFAGGALAAFVASVLGANLFVQVALFVVVSIALVLIVRPLASKNFNQNRAKTNVDALIGKKGFVITEINNLKGEGEVNFSGQIWTARSTDDTIIEEKTEVEIVSIEGVKAMVKKVNQ